MLQGLLISAENRTEDGRNPTVASWLKPAPPLRHDQQKNPRTALVNVGLLSEKWTASRISYDPNFQLLHDSFHILLPILLLRC